MKKILALALAAILAVSLAACGGSSTLYASIANVKAEDFSSYTGATIDAIKAAGKLVVGTEAQYAPFEFLDANANFVGCDMWLAQQMANALGVKLEVVDMSFDGILPAVKSGQVDIGIAAFTVTEERAKEIDFTEVYQRDQQLLIVQKGQETTMNTKEALAGQKVGAQRGTVQSLLIQSALPNSELFELDKWPSLAMEVANGNIAAIVVDGAVGEGLVAANDKIAVADFEFTKEEANFGKAAIVDKSKTDLTELANAVIAKVTENGGFTAAYNESVELAKTLGV